MVQEAEALRKRAASGEDFDQLEKEAFASAGLKGTARTSMGAVRLATLSAGHAEAFALSPGQVSKVISDSTGFYVYKMLIKQVLPLEQVKPEISEILRGQRMKQLSRHIQESSKIELNSAYFAPLEDETSAAASKDESSKGEPEDAQDAEGH
jgi:hypothetical protein